MKLCEFTDNIKNINKNNIFFNKKYSLEGKLFYQNKLYIMNGRKYILF
jgi:hypothetical protein